MIPFHVEFRPGATIYEQVVYAAKKAMMAGQLRPGDAFPSVRTLSRELKINPNTAHKVITHLVQSGLLEIRPGAGTLVANFKPGYSAPNFSLSASMACLPTSGGFPRMKRTASSDQMSISRL